MSNVLVPNDHQERKVVTGYMSRVADMLLKKSKVASENDLFEKFNCRIKVKIYLAVDNLLFIPVHGSNQYQTRRAFHKKVTEFFSVNSEKTINVC